jgi:hypothetical protein
MRSVQVSKPNGPFEIVERKIPEPRDGNTASRFRLAVFATAILLQNWAYFQISNIQEFLDMKSQASLMK